MQAILGKESVMTSCIVFMNNLYGLAVIGNI